MRIATALLLLAAMAMTACGGTQPPAAAPASSAAPAESVAAPAGSAAAAQDLKAPGEAKVGDKTTCPVMKHPFVVSESSPKLEYEGKTYYFCCPGCIEQFKANPKKYL
jgi:xanthine dehydrogenase accessory factor